MVEWLCTTCKKNLNCGILKWQNKINNLITTFNLANEQRMIVECKKYIPIEEIKYPISIERARELLEKPN